MAVNTILKPLKVTLFIKKKRGRSKLYNIEITETLTLTQVDVDTPLRVDHNATFLQLLMAVEDPSSVLMVHLIIYKDIRNDLENARVECPFLLSKSLNSIKHGGFEDASV